MGWSQSGNYLATYVRYFLEESPYDAYFSAGAVHSFVTTLNQEDIASINDLSLTKINKMPKPFIAVQTESENYNFGGNDARMEDSDSEEFNFRLYEVPGATHDTKFSLLDYYAD